jgi:FAD/FMN-containing dehydrogenase
MTPITDPSILEGYLRDASNLRGHADALYRPRTVEELQEVVATCQASGTPLTVTARRTSTTGAPVPMGGALLSTEMLDRVLGPEEAEGGVLLGQFQAELERTGRLFPPDPTSRNDCSLGGAIACNASGARTFKYGPTRRWIEEVEVVLATGERLVVDRTTPSPWPVPRWTEPAVKTAAGYFPADNLLDLLIGSEGTLGIVTRARVRTLALPSHVLGLVAYFPTRGGLLAFVARARAMGPRCIEYMDRPALDLVRGRLPAVPSAEGCLMLEIEHDDPEPPVEPWFDALVEHGALVDDTLVVTDAAGRARLHALRHAAPAAINEVVARRGLTKVGTDFAVPHERLAEAMAMYDAVPMETACFGHIGDSHLHLNLLPRDPAELARAKELYGELARQAVAMGGTVSAEHGIGRLKRAHLAGMVPASLIEAWRAMRTAADPAGILGRGVMV